MTDDRTRIKPPDTPPDDASPSQTPAPRKNSQSLKALPGRRDKSFDSSVQDPLADMGLASPGEEHTPTPAPVAPAEPLTPSSGAWNWTEQYARKAQKQKIDEDDSRGYEIGDPMLTPEEAQMKAMYVPQEKVQKTHNPDLTFTPRVIPKTFPWRWVFAAVLTLMVACLILSFTVPVDTGEVDPRGNPVSRTLFQSFLKKIDIVVPSGDPAREAFQQTKERIRDVESAAIQFDQRNGTYPPNVDALIEAGLLPEGSASDGWGKRFVLYPVIRKIVSSGADGQLDTLDDIALDSKGLTIPQAYQEFELSKTGDNF